MFPKCWTTETVCAMISLDDEIGNLTQLNITEFCCIPAGILSPVDDSLRHNVDIVFVRADTRDSRDFFMVKMKTEFQIF